MKKILSLLLLMAATTRANAQNYLMYGYDAVGNRIYRLTATVRSKKQTRAMTDSASYNKRTVPLLYMKSHVICCVIIFMNALLFSCESYIDLPYYVMNKSEDSIYVYANGGKGQSQNEAGPVAPDSIWRDYINEKDFGMLRVHIAKQRTVDSLAWSDVLQNDAFDKTFVFSEEELLKKKRLIIYKEE